MTKPWPILILIFLAGCGYQHFKGEPGRAGQETAALSFAGVKAQVLAPSCLGCHGAGSRHSLETYEAVKALIPTIEKAVFVDRTMPKNRTLPDEQLAFLRRWLDAGAPEHGPVTPNPEPSPAPTGNPTWERVRVEIFEKNCTSCHGGLAPEAGFDASQLTEVRKRAVEIFEHAVIERSMPPEQPLSDAERDLLARWMAAGMPD